jgi:glycosyltransferase involved in cell wall biosynthesis
MSRPLVTIAIPTYNRAAFSLAQALRCALAQTYPELEILVSDNCSTDDTEHLVRSFDDRRIRYVRQAENIGANNNFNYCINEARGVYFLLFHDDDMIDPDLVDVCMTAAGDAETIGLVRAGTRLIDADGAILEEYPNRVGGFAMTAFILGWFAGKTGMYLCSTLFHRRSLAEVGGLKSKHNLFQDVGAEMRVAARFGRIDVPAVKASFRMHTNVMYSEAKIAQWCEDSLELLDVLCELVPPADRERVRSEGIRYFCNKMYTYASRLPLQLARLRTYWRIFGTFGHVYSPARYVYARDVWPYVHAVRQRAARLAAIW